MTLRQFKLFAIVALCSILTTPVLAQTEIKALMQAQVPLGAGSETSFLNKGTGLFRYDDGNDEPQLAQALIAFKSEIINSLTVEGVLNHTRDPENFTNFSQLNVRYRPLWSHQYRWQFRAGMFYPQFGFENPGLGWTSPFNYTNSAISSWIGEELRTIGAEVKLTLPGKAHKSSHTWSFIGSVYKSNDTVGSILSWRGWALHDKQTLFNQVVPFADYPVLSLPDFIPHQASWVEPFREIDGRWGMYAGIHWDYKRRSQFRYYYYNNRADENTLGRNGQYAWQTLFHNLSWQYLFNRNLRFVAHYMAGNTSMGPYKVNVDFNSWYTLLSYKKGKYRFSGRYEQFRTGDKDLYPQDDNRSNGIGFTTSWRYDWQDWLQIGLEYSFTNRFQPNRAQWGRTTDLTQHQTLAVIQLQY